MNFNLIPILDCDIKQYKADFQEAFQKGFEQQFGETDQTILPERDIDQSLNVKG